MSNEVHNPHKSRTSARIKLALLAIFLSLFALLIPKQVHALPVLDQSFLGGSGSVSGEDDFAQTFRVGISGRLTNVAVRIFGLSDVILDIRHTQLGAPRLSNTPEDQLASVILDPPELNFGLVNADLTAFGIFVEAGDVLAIVLRSTGVKNWGVAHDTDATYHDGEAFLRTGSTWQTFPEVFPSFEKADFQFQTFVVREVGEPVTLGLLAVGMLLGGFRISGQKVGRFAVSRCGNQY